MMMQFYTRHIRTKTCPVEITKRKQNNYKNRRDVNYVKTEYKRAGPTIFW